MTQVKLGTQFPRGKFPGHMGYRCKGMALVLLSQPCLNAKAWWCPLMSSDVGYGGREIVHPNQPVEFVWGPGPVRGEESGPTPSFPLWSRTSRFVTGSLYSSSLHFAEKRMSNAHLPCRSPKSELVLVRLVSAAPVTFLPVLNYCHLSNCLGGEALWT